MSINGLRLRNIAELFNRSIGGSMRIDTDSDFSDLPNDWNAAIDACAEFAKSRFSIGGVNDDLASELLKFKRVTFPNGYDGKWLNAVYPKSDRPDGDGLLLKALGCSLYNFDGAEFVECKHSVWNEILERLGVPAPTRDGAEGAGDLPLAVRLRDEERPPLPQMIAQRRVQLSATPPKLAPDAMREALKPIYLMAICPAKERCACACKDWKWRDVRCEEDMARVNAILDCAPSAPVPSPDGAGERKRWFLASQNDGLFIINSEPRPSNDDAWHDRPDGPSIVLNVTELPEAKAIKIVGVMNELASPSPAVAAEPVAEMIRTLRNPGPKAREFSEFLGNVADMLERLASPPVRGDREAIRKVFDGWLERFEDGDPIQFTPAREYASDAVRDCRDAVLALLTVQPGTGERDETIRECIVAAGSCSADGLFTPGGMRSAIIKDLKALSRQAPHSSREGGR